MDVLVTCQYDEDLIKNRGARVFTTLYINFSDTQGQITRVGGGIWLKFELIQAFMHVPLPARMRMIKSKMKELECSQDLTHYKSMGIFPDAQGQLTPQSSVKSGPNSNLTAIFWLSSLPVSMKKIRSKMKVLACSHYFPHYNPMEAIRCQGHQSSDPIWSKT